MKSLTTTVFNNLSFRFVHDWVYSGVFRDAYGEFMIQVNEEYLGFRGMLQIKVSPLECLSHCFRNEKP